MRNPLLQPNLFRAGITHLKRTASAALDAAIEANLLARTRPSLFNKVVARKMGVSSYCAHLCATCASTALLQMQKLLTWCAKQEWCPSLPAEELGDHLQSADALGGILQSSFNHEESSCCCCRKKALSNSVWVRLFMPGF